MFVDDELISCLLNQLIPKVTLVTPNSEEVRKLSGGIYNLDGAAGKLLANGSDYVLVTGSHEPGTVIRNTLYNSMGQPETTEWPRLPHTYHGSGCTLSAAIASLLAQGVNIPQAVQRAQQYTWDSLKHGTQPGRGQYLPDRLFWGHYRYEGERE
jgi:hydroxymethylpyrimidine/phosphomethylpyrimidine kinase